MYTATITTIDKAREIMGEAFIGPEALQRHFDVRLTAKLRRLFGQVPFDVEVLQQCADTHVLVACGALSLMRVKQAQWELFCHGIENPWYEHDRFFRKKAKAGWHLIRKGPVPRSADKSWVEQNALLGADESVPTVSELAQTILLCHLVGKEHQFDKLRLRTADVDTEGYHVFLDFGLHGLYINVEYQERRSGVVGLASSRNLS